MRDRRARSWKTTVLALSLLVLLSAAAGPAQSQEQTTARAVNDDNQATANDRPADADVPTRSFEVKGLCLDDDGNPLEDTEVLLFFFERYGASPGQRWQQRTSAAGEYRFRNLKFPIESDDRMEYYLVAARKPNYASTARILWARDRKLGFDLTLAPNPGTLSGRVTNERGDPLVGVEVYLGYGGAPIPGFRHAVSGSDGRFVISDMNRWDAKDAETFDSKTGTGTRGLRRFFSLRHPDYPVTRGSFSAVPQEVNVVLQPGMTIEGRVLDSVTGRPAAGAIVSVQGVKEHGDAQVTTDEQGAYRLVLTADQYNIRASAKDRTSAALDSFAGAVGKTTQAPGLRLTSGGFFVGTIFDKATGKPLGRQSNGHPWRVAHHGPAFPKSGAAVGTAAVAEDGTYRLRVAPGPNYPYLMHDVESERTPRNATRLPPILVGEGETVTLDFHVGAVAKD